MPNFRLPCFPVSSCMKGDAPAAKGTENTQNNDAEDAATSSALPTTNKKTARNSPSLLQKIFKRTKQSGEQSSENSLLGTTLAAAQIQRPGLIAFNPEKQIEAAEIEAKGKVEEYFSKLGEDVVLTTTELNKTIDRLVEASCDDIERRFQQDEQDALPGQSPDKFVALKEQAKERLTQTVINQIHSKGWRPHQPETINVQWEPGNGPLLNKRHFPLQHLTLCLPNLAEGKYGSISVFENENGDDLMGKTSKPVENRSVDDLGRELAAYKKIYNKVGPHPNLLNVYGMAKVPHGDEVKRTLLMDAIPGVDGEITLQYLKHYCDTGKISSAEYWGAIQFIGRRLLTVTEHLGKAGVVHNDIKPENFLMNENTGEPVLIDLGHWSEPNEIAPRGAWLFASPEARGHQYVDERSDVYTVGTSLLHGIEEEQSIVLDDNGEPMRRPLPRYPSTAYTEFMEKVLLEEKEDRVTSVEAVKLSFLSDSILDDDAAKEVIKKIISFAKEE